MSRFTFHETESLASELNRLLQTRDSNLRIDSLGWNNAENAPEDFPGTILLFDDHPCAAIGYTWEPGGTVAVSEPVVLLDVSDTVFQSVCSQLLKHAKRRAAAAGAKRLHYLQRAASDQINLTQLLTEHSFVQTTDILRWERKLTKGHQGLQNDQFEFELNDFQTSDAEASHDLIETLSLILACSNDLRSLPQPGAAELVALWKSIQATVMTCRLSQNIVGVISCALRRTRSLSTVSISSPPVASVCIEYVGVVPEFRRRRIASLMIQQIPWLAASDSYDPTQQLPPLEFDIATYSDAGNTPARRLYQSCGFTETARMHLWCFGFDPAFNPEF